MIRLFLVTILFSTGSSLVAAPVPKELKKELKTEGTWEMVNIDAYGRKLNFAPGLQWTLDDKGNMISSQTAKPNPNAKSTIQFTFHPEDKTVEYRYTNGMRVCPGLFKLEDDTLTICCSMKAGGERPKVIEGTADTYVWTMKRAKEDK